MHTKRICIASLCLKSQSTSQRMAGDPLGVSSPCKPKFLPQDSRIPRPLILSMTHEVAKSQDEFVQESQTACDSRPSLLLCEPHQHDKFCCTQTRSPRELWCCGGDLLAWHRYNRTSPGTKGKAILAGEGISAHQPPVTSSPVPGLWGQSCLHSLPPFSPLCGHVVNSTSPRGALSRS